MEKILLSIVLLIVFSISNIQVIGFNHMNLNYSVTQHNNTKIIYKPIFDNPINSQNSTHINPFIWVKKEPAPIGIADYGIGPNGQPYVYITKEFEGVVTIDKLRATDVNYSNPCISIQLNVVLSYVYKGFRYSLWVQDGAGYNTLKNTLSVGTNIWNLSSPDGSISEFSIIGNGTVVRDSSGTYFYDYQSSGLPGENINLTLPITLYLLVNTSLNSLGQPVIYLCYDDGYGWVNYDKATIINVANVSEEGFMVNGYEPTPSGLLYDAALVVVGAGSGTMDVLNSASVYLQLYYFNGHNLQEITNAYNFGINTGESLYNASDIPSISLSNGSMSSHITGGNASLGILWTQNQIGIIKIITNANSGQVIIYNGKYPQVINFINKSAIISIYPGTYKIAVLTSLGYTIFNVTVIKGKEAIINDSNILLKPTVEFTLNSIYIGLRSSLPRLPLITITYPFGVNQSYILYNGSRVLYLPLNTSWEIKQWEIYIGISDRWYALGEINGTISTLHNVTINITYYQQYLVTFSYEIPSVSKLIRGPIVSFYQFGKNITIAISNASGINVWVDANSPYVYQKYLPINSTLRFSAKSYEDQGTIVLPTKINVIYYEQYYITIKSNFPAYAIINGINSPLESGWYYMNTKINIENITYYHGNSTRFILLEVIPAKSLIINKSANISLIFLEQFLVNINNKSSWYNNGSILVLNSGVPFYDIGRWVGTYNLSNPTSVIVNKPITEKLEIIMNKYIIVLIAIIVIIAITVIILMRIIVRRK